MHGRPWAAQLKLTFRLPVGRAVRKVAEAFGTGAVTLPDDLKTVYSRLSATDLASGQRAIPGGGRCRWPARFVIGRTWHRALRSRPIPDYTTRQEAENTNVDAPAQGSRPAPDALGAIGIG